MFYQMHRQNLKKIVTSWIDGIAKMAQPLKNFTTKNITNKINFKTSKG